MAPKKATTSGAAASQQPTGAPLQHPTSSSTAGGPSFTPPLYQVHQDSGAPPPPPHAGGPFLITGPEYRYHAPTSPSSTHAVRPPPPPPHQYGYHQDSAPTASRYPPPHQTHSVGQPPPPHQTHTPPFHPDPHTYTGAQILITGPEYGYNAASNPSLANVNLHPDLIISNLVDEQLSLTRALREEQVWLTQIEKEIKGKEEMLHKNLLTKYAKSEARREMTEKGEMGNFLASVKDVYSRFDLDNNVDCRCLMCRAYTADILMFPCMHVSICNRCDVKAFMCPICCSNKLATHHLTLPMVPIVYPYPGTRSS